MLLFQTLHIHHIKNIATAFVVGVFLVSCSSESDAPVYDLVIAGGTIYDGSGSAPIMGDVAIVGDRIAAVGDIPKGVSHNYIDATGKAVSPGFINMLSWAPVSLMDDGRGMSDTKQGITLEVFGEGWTYGPINDKMTGLMAELTGDLGQEITWTTMGGFMEALEASGITPNVASFVGATTVRIYVLGEDDVDPTPAQLVEMQNLVREAMREGAVGVGSSLIYAPASYSETPELIALVKAAAEYGGGYISHMRSEGDRLIEAVDELITIAREADTFGEIYHLKAGGRDNWPKMDQVLEMVEAARAEGLQIGANMYTYQAGATGLDAAMPTWVQAGGQEAWFARLRDPAIRARVIDEMQRPGDDWENLFYGAGPEGMLVVQFKNDALKKYVGWTIAQVAEDRGTSPADTIIDLVLEDETRVGTVYFLMSEENIRKQIAKPWVSFDSDAASIATDGRFSDQGAHPRTYGNFARLFAKYVREEGVISISEAVRRLTSLPATRLKIRDRGLLAEGYYGDVVVFDPATIQDHSTFDQPHQYSTGVDHVVVNGVQVLKDGAHTGAMPGRFVRGPGWPGHQP